MAGADSNIVKEMVEYGHHLWGELIYGTKEQLMALGLGVNVKFPETSKRFGYGVIVTDPRGYKTKIRLSDYKGDRIYSASISFPGREFPREKWEPFAPGVGMVEYAGWDKYIGTAEALAAAGLIQLANLPGQPGMGKVQVTLSPDGLRNLSHNGHKKRQPGEITIKRVSQSRFTVQIRVTQDVSEMRRDAYIRRRDEWEREMAALPRPAPLAPLGADVVLSKQIEHARQDKGFQAFMSVLT